MFTLMYSEVAWVLVSLGAQAQPQILLEPHYLPDYLSVYYDYNIINRQTIFHNIMHISNFENLIKFFELKGC